MARTGCRQKLLKAVLFTCLMSHLTRAEYKENLFLRYNIGLEGCEQSTSKNQNESTTTLAMMCLADDNCSAFQYSKSTRQYQICHGDKITSLSQDGRSYWVKRTRIIQDVPVAGGVLTNMFEMTAKSHFQVGTLEEMVNFFIEARNGDISLGARMCIRYENSSNLVILYSLFNGDYGTEVRTNFTFLLGEKYLVFVLLTADSFVMMINGQLMPKFKYVFPVDLMTGIKFAGFCKLHELSF